MITIVIKQSFLVRRKNKTFYRKLVLHYDYDVSVSTCLLMSDVDVDLYVVGDDGDDDDGVPIHVALRNSDGPPLPLLRIRGRS